MRKRLNIYKKLIVLIIIIFLCLVSKNVYATEELKNATRVYFSSGVTQNSGQRRLYFTRKL